MPYKISPPDRARFITPLPDKAEKFKAPPLLMGGTKFTGDVPLEESTLRFISQADSMCDVKADLEIKEPNTLGPGDALANAWVLRDIIDHASQIVGDLPIMNFSAAVYILVTPYDRPIKLDRGIHLESPEVIQKPMPRVRLLNIVMGNPLPTIALDITPKKARYTVAGKGISYNTAGELTDSLIVPEPGQMMAMQELTPHATPRMTREISSYDDAVKLYADRPDTLRWFRRDSYTRLFATAFARYRI